MCSAANQVFHCIYVIIIIIVFSYVYIQFCSHCLDYSVELDPFCHWALTPWDAETRTAQARSKNDYHMHTTATLYSSFHIKN